ncbi:MAG: redoxin domain-containing protein [Rhizobiales bacterium]|nr:redoxin domain-containing protein [Hyphomicrobiales bacterium]
MPALTPLFPRQPVPALEVATLSGRRWSLAESRPEHFTMLVVYRGLHCPICRGYLTDLQTRLDEFRAAGVEPFVLSSDDRERAAKAQESWKLDRLDLGYGLTIEQARAWGLYVSRGRGKTSIGIEEPAIFVEPGLFMVRPDGTLYFASVQTMPFARPHFADILGAVQFVTKNGYPARGEVLSGDETS